MSQDAVDTDSQAFAARLASLVRTARSDRGLSVRAVARATGGAASARQLRAIEAERADLGALDIATIVAAYGVELGALLGERVTIEIDSAIGTLRTAGITRRFGPDDPDTLLIEYLRLVRQLRDLPHEPTLALRRDDVELLASHLDEDATTVLERLGELMGATATQRRSMVTVFAAGAALVVLGTSASALAPATYSPSDGSEPADRVAISTVLGHGGDEHAGESSEVVTFAGASSLTAPATAASATDRVIDPRLGASDRSGAPSTAGRDGATSPSQGTAPAPAVPPEPVAAPGQADATGPRESGGDATPGAPDGRQAEGPVDLGDPAPPTEAEPDGSSEVRDGEVPGPPDDALQVVGDEDQEHPARVDDGVEPGAPPGGTGEPGVTDADDEPDGTDDEPADGTDEGSDENVEPGPHEPDDPADGDDDDSDGDGPDGGAGGGDPYGGAGDGDPDDDPTNAAAGGSDETGGDPPDTAGEGPGNSRGAGKSGTVGTPGNSGNDQAGGGGGPNTP